MTEVTVPGLRLVSETNSHTHWRVRQKRAKDHHARVRIALRGVEKPPPKDTLKGLRVVFTRVIGPRGQEFDDDNLVGAFKFVRDAVAQWAGVDDRDPWWDWVVNRSQERGPEYAVRIELEPVAM